MNLLYIFFGISIGIFFFEPLLINFVYFSNIALFEDLILTKKNKEKLEKYYNNGGKYVKN